MSTNDTLKIAGLKLKIDGGAEFTKSLEALNLEFRKSKLELAKVTAEYGNNSNSIEVLSAKQTYLNNNLNTQKNITQALNETMAAAVKLYGEGSIESERLSIKIQESELREIKFKKSVEEAAAAIAERAKAQDALTDKSSKFSETMEALNLEVKKSASELAVVNSEYGKGSQAIEVLTAKHKNLQDNLEVQKKTTEALKEVLAEVTEKYGANSKEITEWQIKLNNSIASENDYKRSVEEAAAAIAERAKAQDVSADKSEEFRKTIELLNLEIKKSNAEFSKATAEFGKDATSIEALNAKYKDLQNTLEAQEKKTKEYRKQLDHMSENYSENTAELVKLQTEVINSEAAEIKYRKSLEETAIAIKESEEAQASLTAEQEKSNAVVDESTEKILQLKQAIEEMQKSGKDFAKFGKDIQDIGKGFSTLFTAPILALGGITTKLAVDFESSFADVRKTIDTTEEGYNKLSEAIRKMSTEIPASAEAISQVAANAGQLGIAEENVMSFTRTMIDLGESTNLSADNASTTLAKFANITKMSQKDFDRLGSTIVALGNNFATSESDIAAMAMRLAGAGNNVKMSEAQILALAAALSSLGVEAEAGGSAFSKVIANIQLAVETGSKDLQQYASVAGMSVEQFAKAFKEDAATALTAFISGLGKLDEQGESTIVMLENMGLTEVRLRDSLLRTSGAHEILTNSMTLANQAWEENTALSNEAEARYGTTASQLKILENNIAEAGRSLGEGFLPFLNKVIDMAKPTIEEITGLATEFKNLGEWQQEAIINTGLFVAAIGPVTYGVGKTVEIFGKAKTAIGLFKEALTVVESGAVASSAAVTGLSTAINILKGPVGWVTLAIGALAAGWNIYKLSQEASRQEIINTTKELQQLRSEIESSTEKISSIDELAAQWENLNAVISNTSNYDELLRAKEDLAVVEQKLIDLSDGLITSYSLQSGSVNEQMSSIRNLTEAERELAILRLQQKINDTDISKIESETQALVKRQEELTNTAYAQLKAYETLKTLEIEYKRIVDDATLSAHERSEAIASINKRADEARESFGGLDKGIRSLSASADDANNALGKTNTALEDNIKKQQENESAISRYNSEASLLEDLKMDKTIANNTDAAIDNTGATNNNTDALLGNIQAGEQQIKTLEDMKAAQDELNKKISSHTSALDGLDKAYKTLHGKQELNSEQLLDMIDKYPLVAEYINLTGDATLNNGEIVKQVFEIKKQDFANTLEMRKNDVANELKSAQDRINITSQEYAEKTRLAGIFYSDFHINAMLQSGEDLKKQTEYLNSLQNNLKSLEAQLKVVNNITVSTGDAGTKSGDKTAKSLSKASDEAETLAIKMSEAKETLKEAADSTEEYYQKASEASAQASEATKDTTVKAALESAEKSKAAMADVIKYKEETAVISARIDELLTQKQTKTTEAELKKLYKSLDENVKLMEKAAETAVNESAKAAEEIAKANENSIKLIGDGLTTALKSQYDDMNDEAQRAIDEQVNYFRQGSYDEVQISKDASIDKIRIWNDEYFTRLSQINDIEDAYIESVRNQINTELSLIKEKDAKIAGDIAIQNAKSEEAKKNIERMQSEREMKQRQERLRDLDEAIASAKTDEERTRAANRKQDYLDDITYQTELKKWEDEYNAALEQTQNLKKEQIENIKQGQENINKIQETGLKDMLELLTKLKERTAEQYKELSDLSGKEAAEMLMNFGTKQEDIIKLLNTYNPRWQEAGKSFMDYFQEGIDNGEIDLEEILQNINKTVAENGPEKSLTDMIKVDNEEVDENLKETAKVFENNKDQAKKSSQIFSNAIKEPISNLVDSMYGIGQNSAQGFIDGMSSKLDQARAIGAALGEATSAGLINAQEIASPSKVMRRLGQFTGDGLILGLEDKIAGVKHISQLLAEASIIQPQINNVHRNSAIPTAIAAPQTKQNQPNIIVNVNVAKVDATNERNIQALGEQLAFVIKKKLIGTGDA